MKRFKEFSQRLSVRSLLLALGSIVTFSLVLSLLLYFGLGQIMRSWHESEVASLHQYITDRLLEQHELADAQGKEVTQIDIDRALEGLPFTPAYLVVTKDDGSLIYYYREAERGSGGAGRARNMLQNLQDVQNWKDVRLEDGTLVFRYDAHIPDFDEQESNRIVIAASKLLLVWGLAFAGILSFLFAYLFTRPLKNQTNRLVSSLQRMASGERKVDLPYGPVAEFNQISNASAVLQDNLVREERLRRQWAEDIAHDLRTPVSVLQGQLEAMVDGVFKADEMRLLKLLAETTKLEQLVNSLALLSRLETPDFTPKVQKIDLQNFISVLRDRYEEEAKSNGSVIEIGFPQVFLEADPALLDRVLSNLLSNALRYGKEGGRITFSVGMEKEKLVSLSIENEGTIDKDMLPFIFDRLYRGDSARKTEGTGLGLSIVKAIVEAHHWTIEITSDTTTKCIIAFTQSLS